MAVEPVFKVSLAFYVSSFSGTADCNNGLETLRRGPPFLLSWRLVSGPTFFFDVFDLTLLPPCVVDVSLPSCESHRVPSSVASLVLQFF